MRSRSLIAIPVAGALVLGGTGLALAGDSAKPPAKKPATPQAIRAMKLQLPMGVRRGGIATGPIVAPAPFLLSDPGPIMGPFGFDADLATDLAKELNLPADRVTAAVRKVIETRLNKQRDDLLACFDDKKACKDLKFGGQNVVVDPPPAKPVPATP